MTRNAEERNKALLRKAIQDGIPLNKCEDYSDLQENLSREESLVDCSGTTRQEMKLIAQPVVIAPAVEGNAKGK